MLEKNNEIRYQGCNQSSFANLLAVSYFKIRENIYEKLESLEMTEIQEKDSDAINNIGDEKHYLRLDLIDNILLKQFTCLMNKVHKKMF